MCSEILYLVHEENTLRGKADVKSDTWNIIQFLIPPVSLAALVMWELTLWFMICMLFLDYLPKKRRVGRIK